MTAGKATDCSEQRCRPERQGQWCPGSDLSLLFFFLPFVGTYRGSGIFGLKFRQGNFKAFKAAFDSRTPLVVSLLPPSAIVPFCQFLRNQSLPTFSPQAVFLRFVPVIHAHDFTAIISLPSTACVLPIDSFLSCMTPILSSSRLPSCLILCSLFTTHPLSYSCFVSHSHPSSLSSAPLFSNSG